MKNLEDLRKEIDEIDSQIKKLLDKRFEVSKQVGKCKKQTEKNVLDSKRETQILDKIATDKDLAYSNEISEVYKEIMRVSKALQQHIICLNE